MSKSDAQVKRTAKRRIGTVFVYLILACTALVQIFPFWLKIVEALQSTRDFLPKSGKIYLWPQSFHFENFAVAFRESGLAKGYLNSLITTFMSTALSCIAVVVMGYVISKKRFHGKKILFAVLLATMMVPGEVIMIPNYILVAKMGLIDRLAGVFLPGIVNVFGIFLVKQFMDTLPDSVIEAARIDGTNELGMLVRIVVPMSASVIASYIILTVVSSWNEYVWPDLILSGEKMNVQQVLNLFTVSPTSNIRDQILASAALVLTVVPVVAVYLIFQRKFIEGMNLSGLK